MYKLDLDCFFSLPPCTDYVVWVKDDKTFYGIQGRLQMSCTGSPFVLNEHGEPLPGPVYDLAKINPYMLDEITQLDNAERHDEANRKMLDFAQEAGVIQIKSWDLRYAKAFRELIEETNKCKQQQNQEASRPCL